jgi:hypothetical protein
MSSTSISVQLAKEKHRLTAEQERQQPSRTLRMPLPIQPQVQLLNSTQTFEGRHLSAMNPPVLPEGFD